jgi:phage gp29-like protein
MASVSVPRLVDYTGTEIPLPGPPQPPATRVVPTGVDAEATDRYRLYPSRDLRPWTIVEILEEADAGDPYRLIELEEEMVEKDGKIEAILGARTKSIQGLDWEVAPPKLTAANQDADEKANEIAGFCEEALRGVEFVELVGDLMDAVGKPFAVDWITWGTDSGGRIVPQLFSRIPTKHIRWAFKSDEVRVFDPMKPNMNSTGDWGEPLPPYSTVRAIDMTRRDHPTRAGVLRTLVWPYFFKVTVVKDMVAYGERFGLPPRVLKIDEADFDNTERYTKFRSAMKDFAQDLSAVVSKNTELDVKVVATRDGVEVFGAQIDYFDKWMAWKVLGHELTSQSSPGQGQLGITAAMDVRQDIREADCRWLSGIIKRDIFTPMVGWNFGWDAVAQHLVPSLWFDVELPRDMNAESTVTDRILRLFPSLTASRQQIREDYGIAAPVGEEEEDDVLRPVQATAVPSFGGGTDGEEDGGDEEDRSEGPRDMPERIMADAGRPASSGAKQAAVDKLASRGIRSAAPLAEAWLSKIRAALRQAVADGLTLAQAQRRIVELYPELKVADLEQTLREQILLVRLHGRNS